MYSMNQLIKTKKQDSKSKDQRDGKYLKIVIGN